MPSRASTQRPLNRRGFLQIGSGLAVSSFVSPLLAKDAKLPVVSSTRGARSCILIHLLGGPPHLDMWDLKPDAPAEIRGPFKPIDTNLAGLRICEHLPRLARMADRYSLVRSVSHNNHNHTPMIYYSLTGREVDRPEVDNDVRPPLRSDFPHLGAVLAHFKPSPRGLPGYIALPELAVRSSLRGEFKRVRQLLRGGGGGFLGPLFDPLAINGDPGTRDAIPALSPAKEISERRLEKRAALLSILENGPPLPSTRTHRELRDQAVVLTGSGNSVSELFSLDHETPATVDRFGRHRFGRAMLLARRLAEAELPMIAIHFNEMTICDGWDTHSKNFDALKSELLPMLDQGLSALLADLEQRGILDRTLVVVMGEFGRTPRINKDAGRDHWGSCQSVLMAGGGIKVGRVHGSSDRIGAYPATDPVDLVDIQATLFHCMGLDPETIIHDNLHRPYSISTGRVLSSFV